MKFDLNTGWRFRRANDTDWLPATIPGCVHLDLIDNKRIDDPFYRDNELKVQWIENEDWDYQLIVDVPLHIFKKKQLQLIFEGLDTYATVLLNGQKIIEADNMYRPWMADVKSILKERQNVIEVHFRSPIQELASKVQKMTVKLPAVSDPKHGTSPYTRKAPYHFGWDWGPRLVTSGIWQPVRLEAWDEFRIVAQKMVLKELTAKQARLEITTEIRSESDGTATIQFSDADHHISKRATAQIAIGSNILVHQLEIANPELWWPKGYGDQPLYQIQTKISIGKTTEAIAKRIGLRSLALKREADRGGESFTFIINGVPIYTKGADWIPGDSFTPRIPAEKYRYLLTSAIQANMNMLRVWGGGIYESDFFYDLCDELGLLIWQDFMFSCALYPGDDRFLNSVREEAIHQVRRLRHHPCVVLWCGNNEIEMGWHDWGWQEKFPATIWEDYLKLFHGVLPEVCRSEDPTRPYWPSSPASDLDAIFNPNDALRGDTHYWGVWHKQEPFDFYQHHLPRFISEYGFQSFPEPASVKKFTVEADRDIFSPVMLIHQKSGNGNALIKTYMEKYYRVPKDFDHFLLLSQVLQAEGIKSGAEHFRRIRPHCMGSLYWQINDCWPVASWSSIDYYGCWKALHFYARKFYAPILISPNLEDDAYKFYIISDRGEPTAARLIIKLMNFAGEVYSSCEKQVNIRPHESAVYQTILKNEFLDLISSTEAFIYCALVDQQEKIISENALYFELPKNLNLQRPEVLVHFDKSHSDFSIQLTSQNLARSVILIVSGLAGQFDDNFFDLYPNQSREIHFKTDQNIDEADFRRAFSILSLFDLMEMEA